VSYPGSSTINPRIRTNHLCVLQSGRELDKFAKNPNPQTLGSGLSATCLDQSRSTLFRPIFVCPNARQLRRAWVISRLTVPHLSLRPESSFLSPSRATISDARMATLVLQRLLRASLWIRTKTVADSLSNKSSCLVRSPRQRAYIGTTMSSSNIRRRLTLFHRNSPTTGTSRRENPWESSPAAVDNKSTQLCS